MSSRCGCREKKIAMLFEGWFHLSQCQCGEAEGANRERSRSKAAPCKSGSSPLQADQLPATAGQPSSRVKTWGRPVQTLKLERFHNKNHVR